MSGFGQPPGPPPGGPPGGGFGSPPGGGFGQPPGGGFGQPPGGYGAPPGGFGQPPGGGFGAPPGGGGGFGAGPTPPKTDGLALTAVITGGVGLFLTIPLGLCCGLFACLGGVLAVVAIPCGIIAIRRIGNEPDRFKGKGMAIAGVVCGGITLFVFLLAVVLVAVGAITAPQTGSGGWDPSRSSYGGSSDWD